MVVAVYCHLGAEPDVGLGPLVLLEVAGAGGSPNPLPSGLETFFTFCSASCRFCHVSIRKVCRIPVNKFTKAR